MSSVKQTEPKKSITQIRLFHHKSSQLKKATRIKVIRKFIHPNSLRRHIEWGPNQAYVDYLYERLMEKLKTAPPLPPHIYYPELALSSSKVYQKSRGIFDLGKDGEFRNPFLENKNGGKYQETEHNDRRSRSPSPCSRNRRRTRSISPASRNVRPRHSPTVSTSFGSESSDDTSGQSSPNTLSSSPRTSIFFLWERRVSKARGLEEEEDRFRV